MKPTCTGLMTSLHVRLVKIGVAAVSVKVGDFAGNALRLRGVIADARKQSVHLLVTPRLDNSVSRLMQSLGRRYVGHFNFSYTRSGTLFEGRFRSCLVQEDQYFLTCLRYIELNPVRAGMVRDPGDYRWSSYRAHAFGAPVKLWKPHSLYQSLASCSAERQNRWRELVGEVVDTDTISRIRHCTNTGLVLGTEKFRDQVAALRN